MGGRRGTRFGLTRQHPTTRHVHSACASSAAAGRAAPTSSELLGGHRRHVWRGHIVEGTSNAIGWLRKKEPNIFYHPQPPTCHPRLGSRRGRSYSGNTRSDTIGTRALAVAEAFAAETSATLVLGALVARVLRHRSSCAEVLGNL